MGGCLYSDLEGIYIGKGGISIVRLYIIINYITKTYIL